MLRSALPSFAADNGIFLGLSQSRRRPCYWVVAYRSISDESAVKSYGALAVPAVESYGGRFLTRSTSQIRSHEAGLPLRSVLVEFGNYETALAAHESEAYQKALQMLGSAAERDFRIVEGA